MEHTKAPRSLRSYAGTGQLAAFPAATHAGVGVGLVAAACLATTQPAQAQTTTLPALTVEAPAAPKAKKRPATGARSPSRPATPRLVRPAASPPPAQSTTPAAPLAANANPYAQAGAPYKVERSSSSRMSEPLLNTARSVTAVPKEVLEDKGATSVRELVRTTPGLTLGSGEGGNAFGDRVFIRGFDARNDMYINGVRESGVTTRETFMAEQVEIIKGPAGSIAGRGTSGGAINVVTKQPGPVNFYNVSAAGGSDLSRRATLDVNHNLNKDLAVRANGLFQEGNVAGRNHVFDNRYGGAFAAAWKPLENFKASLDYYYVAFDQMPDWGVPFDARTRRPFTESGLNRNNFYGVSARDFQRNAQHLMTQGLEWKIDPNFTLTNKLRYGYTTTDYVASKPGTPDLSNPNPALWSVAATPASRYQINRTIADQLEATARFNTGLFKHTLVSGVEAQREDISQDGYSGLAVECNPLCTTGALTNLWHPTTHLIPAIDNPVRNGRPTKTKVDTLSLYALDTINWDEKLFLNLGGRADRYRITRAPFGGAALSRDDLLLNWNAGLTYKILPNASLYAAYATSSNPVGSELDGNGEDYGSITAANKVFKPERNTSLEAGVKWELFDRKLLLTGAAFQTTKENARETVGAGPAAVLLDSAAYRIRGVEFGVTGNLTEDWSVFAGAVFMESEVTQSNIAANRGRPLANIAHQSINLLTKYRLTERLTIGGQATWKGEILGGTLAAVAYAPGTVTVGGVPTATPGGYNKLPGGWRFDLMAEYQINASFSAKLQVFNLFDKVLYDAFYRSNTPYVYLSPGRSAVFTVQAKF